MDSKLLDNGNLLIICNNDKKKTGGFYVIDLNQENEARPKEALKIKSTDQLDYMEVSKCGRMLTLLGP
jgi:hypothetical protein